MPDKRITWPHDQTSVLLTNDPSQKLRKTSLDLGQFSHSKLAFESQHGKDGA